MNKNYTKSVQSQPQKKVLTSNRTVTRLNNSQRTTQFYQ